MKRLLSVLGLALFLVHSHGAIQVTPDKADAVYQIGEEVSFTVDLGDATGTVDYSLTEDGLKVVKAGKLKLDGKPAKLSGKLDHAGFLRCAVTYKPAGEKPVVKLAGAAIAPEKIGLSLPVPDDFDAFWKKQKAALAKVPMKAELTEVKGQRVPAWDVQITCLGAPVSGYFAKPKDAKPKSLPIVLWVHGAGVRSSSLGNAVTGASKGMLSMDINAHGLPNGKPAKFYQEQNAGPLKNYRHAGREDRETVYFKGMFLRLMRAIDFLTSQPEWDGRTVAVVGHSQGGYQALVAGGLDPRVTFIGSGVPAGCDHSGNASGRIAGWPKIVPLKDGQPDPKILEACRYVDAANFASRFKGEAIMSVGFIDATCPPTSCYAAYNALKGRKQVINEPGMGHAAPAHVKDAFMAAVLKHAGLE